MAEDVTGERMAPLSGRPGERALQQAFVPSSKGLLLPRTPQGPRQAPQQAPQLQPPPPPACTLQLGTKHSRSQAQEGGKANISV